MNLAGRENQGIVPAREFESVIEEARSALLELKSAEDGESVFEQVLQRDEAFNGRGLTACRIW